MSRIQEIEASIRSLSPDERRQLAEDLPRMLPELAGEGGWETILRDPRPRPTLSALGDQIEASCRLDPEAFPAITEAEFERPA